MSMHLQITAHAAITVLQLLVFCTAHACLTSLSSPEPEIPPAAFMYNNEEVWKSIKHLLKAAHNLYHCWVIKAQKKIFQRGLFVLWITLSVQLTGCSKWHWRCLNLKSKQQITFSITLLCICAQGNYHKHITFDTQDQYILWQTPCSTIYWHTHVHVDHVQLVMLADHTLS